VASTSDPVTSLGGLRATPDATVDAISPEGSAMLILPGADSWLEDDGHADVLSLARRFLDTGTPVAAICGATYGLAAAGLLDDRQHTSNAAGFLAASGYAGAHLYSAAPAITDRGLITAGGCFPVEFAAQIFAALELYEPDVLAAWTGLYTTGEEAHFAVLAAA
jgi:putative intracellular protease/amidase